MTFDVIVVGGGTAGCALAARLSEDPWRRVLLIEAGPDHPRTEDFPPEILDAGLMAAAIPGHPNNWSFVGHLTSDLDFPVPRGKVLGGSSALNGTYNIRARGSDFAEWAALGNEEWSYEKCLPFLKAMEADVDFGANRDRHGADGPLPIARRQAGLHPVAQAFHRACIDLGFPEEADKNGEQEPGIGPLPCNAVRGMRVNTGICYLNPVRHRPNLTVLGDTLVSRVVIEQQRAVGVETVGRAGTARIAAREVIACAGAINSAKLLVLSGIGPDEDLRAIGVPVVKDAAGVGKGFCDHPDVLLFWRPKRALGKGDAQTGFENVLNFASSSSRGESDLEILPSLVNLTESIYGRMGLVRKARHLAAALAQTGSWSFANLAQQFARRNDLYFALGLQQAESRGDIFIRSADPSASPDIHYNYLESARDRARMRELIRLGAAILKSGAFAPLFDRLSDLDAPTLADDGLLDAWARAHLATTIHACGTARMGPAGDRMAVVDQYGRVHGIAALRVADTSILPTAPTRGPANSAVLIGERIADFVRREDRQPAAAG